MKVEFTGVWIPSEILEDKNLTLKEKTFLAGLKYLYTGRECTATNAEMSKFFNLSERTVSKIIASLDKKGYLIVSYDNGKRVIY